MPRVLIAGFCAVPGPDRVGVQLRHVIRALARHHTVDVLAVRRGDQAYVEKLDGARVLRVPVPDGPVFDRIDAFRRALRRQLEGADYDLVQVRDGWSGVPVLEMQGRLRYAVVFDAGRSPLTEPPSYDHDTAVILERDEMETARRADLVLVASEPARMYMASLVPPERVRVVPPGVDVDAFDWDEPPAGPPRILYTGALTPGRGVRVLLRAMLDVAARCDAQLALAGRATPEFFASLESAVRDLKLDGRVQLLGEVAHEDVPALIASATVCVAPGAIDLGPKSLALYPTKLLEYMACQRAVVAPNRSTVAMLVRDEQHALLFEPGQPIELAARLLRLLEDAELRVRMARAGYELVRRAHTASGTRREMRRAYAWLASVSPWRERLAAVLEEMPTRDMPALAAAESTGGGAWVARRAAPDGERPIAAFDGDGFDDLTEAGQVDTGVTEGLGEVTKVETPPVADEDRAAPGFQPLATSVTAAPLDEWVVDDDRIRDAAALAPPPRADRSSATPIDARFVAGELEVPTGTNERLASLAALDSDEAFTAMGPRLGGHDSGDAGRAAAARQGEDEERTESRQTRPPETATGETTALRRPPAAPVPPAPPPLVPVSRAGEAGSGPTRGPTPGPRAGEQGGRPPQGGSPSVVVGPDLQVRVGTGDDTGP